MYVDGESGVGPASVRRVVLHLRSDHRGIPVRTEGAFVGSTVFSSVSELVSG